MRINPWLEKSKENIIPLSLSCIFNEALGEWYFTGDVEDHGEATMECELCEHPELRYHFEIGNKNNNNSLWVGSSCILKFQEIDVFDEDGNELRSELDRKEQLNKELKKRLEEKLLDPLRNLWRIQTNILYRKEVERIVEKYKKNSAFQPDELVWLFTEMKKNDIGYDPKRYKLTLRSHYDKSALKLISIEQLRLIHPCFSVEQEKRFKNIIDILKANTN
ncbi:MAG: hypothetical protein OCD00_17565 [Colwellia sp.]